MPFAAVNGIDVHYRIAGHGPETIVLVNGLADDLETWAFQEAELTEAGASVPLVFLISMVGLIATAASLALFSGVFPSAGSFLTYIARAMGTRASVVVGVMTLLGYIIAFGGIYIFVGQYITANVLNDLHIWGITQIVTIIYGALVVAPVVLGLKFGVRTASDLVRRGPDLPRTGPAVPPTEPPRRRPIDPSHDRGQ
jgi:amino acid permease-like protein